MKRKINITVLVDEFEIPTDDPELRNPPGNSSTEYHVVEAVRLLGHNVSVLAATEDIELMITKLKEFAPDVVFNLTEHLGGERRFDKNIAGLLEMLGIPFTGAGPVGLLLSRDKSLCKQLLSLHKIRIPKFISIPVGQNIKVPKSFPFPAVVKPAFEDGSEGISNASKVDNVQGLVERVNFIHERWQQPVIVEEYIDGREFYVTVIGNKKLKVLPLRECRFNSDGEGGPSLATYRVKWNDAYRKKWDISFGFAEVEDEIFKSIERVCKKVYRTLGLRDYGRIDLRLKNDNKIVILEANSNPDLAFGEEVAEAAEKAGISYEELIKQIIRNAYKRK